MPHGARIGFELPTELGGDLEPAGDPATGDVT